MNCNECFKRLYDKLSKENKYNKDINNSIKQIDSMMNILKNLVGKDEHIDYWLKVNKMLSLEYKALDKHYENKSKNVIKKLDLILNQ